jgi:hypothetical protein
MKLSLAKRIRWIKKFGERNGGIKVELKMSDVTY